MGHPIRLEAGDALMTKKQLWRVADTECDYVGYFDTEADAIAMVGASTTHTIEPAVVEWPARLQVEPTAGRPIYIDRAEAEFIDDACIEDGAPQWHELQDQVREKFGMTPVNRPAEPGDEPEEPDAYELDDALRIARLWRAGKMIVADEDAVLNALLAEIERMRAEPPARPADERTLWECSRCKMFSAVSQAACVACGAKRNI